MNKTITFIWAGIIFALFNFGSISEAQNMVDNNQGVSVRKVTFPNNNITMV